MPKKDITYLIVDDRKPRNKEEFRQVSDNLRIESIRTSLDGSKYIVKYDGSRRPRPQFLDGLKFKSYTHEQLLREIHKKNSEWETQEDD